MLLRLARQGLEDFLTTGRWRPLDKTRLNTELMQRAGVFVTLRRQGKLRGCIGRIEADTPLAEAVVDTAIASAMDDPRFPPMDPAELQDLTIEISVLTPFKKIAHVDEIQPGRHGVFVNHSGRRGLFLPQVWKETGWTRQRFLEELCQHKACIPLDQIEDPETEWFVFEVDSFED